MMIKRLCILALAVVPMAGCSIQGKWVASDATMTEAECQFQNANFMADDTFTCKATVKGRGEQTWSGKYEYNGMSGKLVLKPEGGEQREYTAKVMGDSLKVSAKQGDETITQEFDRVTCDACGCADCKCAMECKSCGSDDCKCVCAACGKTKSQCACKCADCGHAMSACTCKKS
jgi:hypothetical protein